MRNIHFSGSIIRNSSQKEKKQTVFLKRIDRKVEGNITAGSEPK